MSRNIARYKEHVTDTIEIW